jgi:hypothetical protein
LGKNKVTIHHPTKTGENGQILVKFGAKNLRKSAKYMCAFKKIFPAKIGDKFVWNKFERVNVPKGEIQGCISSMYFIKYARLNSPLVGLPVCAEWLQNKNDSSFKKKSSTFIKKMSHQIAFKVPFGITIAIADF